jgi:putative transposase
LTLIFHMARLNRFVVAGLAHHVTHRAVSGTSAFTDAEDRRDFLQILKRCSLDHHVAVHAYVLLDFEFQLLATPEEADQLSRMMQALARFYVPSFNRRHRRAGALWQGRFRAAPVAGAQALLDCMRYLEQAPQRSGWAGSLLEFDGSSASHHAGRATLDLLAPVPVASAYWALGNTPFARDAAYQALLERPVSAALAASMEASTPLGWALTSGSASAELARVAPRRLSVRAKGRPAKLL